LDQTHIRDVNRAFALGNLTLRMILRLAHVLLNNAHALNENALLLRKNLEDLAGGTAKVPGNDLDVVALLNVKLHPAHKTSGASETIFMKFRSRSSRATGPKIRVPRGFRCASMITAAFSSNAICVPSSRPWAFFVRTI